MQTIQAGAGSDLFHLAARYLGDATQWIRIAQQNNLADPFLSAQQALVIPDMNPALTGGIPQPQ